MKETVNILGVNILNTSYEEMSSLVEKKIKAGAKFSFHNVNASILLEYCRNDIFKKYLDSFSVLPGDGIGVFLASKILYCKEGLEKRITGTDLYYHILNLANKEKYKCFFFGGSKEAAGILRDTLSKYYPGLKITGVLSRESEFSGDTLEKIKNSESDILFIGLGTPHQEKWISENFNSVDIPVQIAVGSGIEFISGAKKRAPEFFRSAGLEWLYSIYLEPGRLWKRYVFGIPIFMFKIIILKVKLLLNKFKN